MHVALQDNFVVPYAIQKQSSRAEVRHLRHSTCVEASTPLVEFKQPVNTEKGVLLKYISQSEGIHNLVVSTCILDVSVPLRDPAYIRFSFDGRKQFCRMVYAGFALQIDGTIWWSKPRLLVEDAVDMRLKRTALNTLPWYATLQGTAPPFQTCPDYASAAYCLPAFPGECLVPEEVVEKMDVGFIGFWIAVEGGSEGNKRMKLTHVSPEEIDRGMGFPAGFSKPMQRKKGVDPFQGSVTLNSWYFNIESTARLILDEPLKADPCLWRFLPSITRFRVISAFDDFTVGQTLLYLGYTIDSKCVVKSEQKIFVLEGFNPCQLELVDSSIHAVDGGYLSCVPDQKLYIGEGESHDAMQEFPQVYHSLLEFLHTATIRGKNLYSLFWELFSWDGNSHPFAITGGAIRDLLREQPLNDVDIVISSLYFPLEMRIKDLFTQKGESLTDNSFRATGKMKSFGQMKIMSFLEEVCKHKSSI